MITVGSFDFTESVVLAEVYSQALEAAGFRVERAFGLGPREFVGPALDGRARRAAVPSTPARRPSSTASATAEPTDDVAATHAALERAIAGRAARRPGRRAGAGRQHVRRHRGDGGASRRRRRSATSPASPAS